MSEVATSQPPPATETGAPWGSFYTVGSTGVAPALPMPKKKGKAKRKRSAEPKPQPESPIAQAEGEMTQPEDEKSERRARGFRRGGRRAEDKRRSFSLQRGPREKRPAPPVPSPVIAATPSRRYTEPHVLVGVVGSTIIALYALIIALLYMIGNAA